MTVFMVSRGVFFFWFFEVSRSFSRVSLGSFGFPWILGRIPWVSGVVFFFSLPRVPFHVGAGGQGGHPLQQHQARRVPALRRRDDHRAALPPQGGVSGGKTRILGKTWNFWAKSPRFWGETPGFLGRNFLGFRAVPGLGPAR